MRETSKNDAGQTRQSIIFWLTAVPYTASIVMFGLSGSWLPNSRKFMKWIEGSLWAPVWLKLGGAKVTRSGFHNELDPQQPYVFVSNHQGFFDIPATLVSAERPLSFVAKRELLRVPFLGLWLWRSGAPIVDRFSREKSLQAFDQAAQEIRNGTTVLVYAEGTRTKDGEIQQFKKGAAVLAIKAQVPIVPITITGSLHAMASGGGRLNPSSIEVHYGHPIPTQGLCLDDRTQLTDVVRTAIMARYSLQRTDVDSLTLAST